MDALKDLKVISSDTAGLISNVAEVAPALVDTLNLLQTHFILSVNYQLALAGQGYSVSYSQLPAANMAVAVYAPPQEVGAFSVFFPMKLSQLGVADTVPVPVLSQLLAQWVDTNATCQSQGQNSNACVMASAHWNDDAWYDQVLTGGDVVCQFNGTSTFSSCSQQFGCQSIGPGNSGNLARQESPSAATALPAPADRSQNTSAMKRTNVTVLASPGRVAPSGTCTISGVARGANGQLLADATVQLTISLDGTSIPTISVTTDSNGSYSTTFNAPPVAGRVSIMATLVGTSPPATAKTALTVATERP